MQEIAKELKEFQSTWWGFMASRVLLTSNKLGVFNNTIEYISPNELSVFLDVDNRALVVLLDCLCGMGFLEKSGGKYKNTKTASLFLVKTSPFYQGDLLRHGDTLWKRWSLLDRVVRNGELSDELQHIDMDAFIRGMHNIASLRASDVIDSINLDNVTGDKPIGPVLDLGGGPGTYTVEFARRGASVVLFDKQEALSIASNYLSQSGLDSMVELMSGDFTIDSFGSGYGIVFVSQVLHSYSDDENKELLRRVHAALSDGGEVCVQEFFIEDDLTKPVESALFSVNMLVGTAHGRCYRPVEIIDWMSKAGFSKTEVKELTGTVLVKGWK